MDPKTRADQAQAIIGNQVFQDAFKTLEAYYTDQMVSTKPEEVEERNKWHSCLSSLFDVKTTLTAFIQDGTIELANAQKRERVKNDGTGTNDRDKQ